MRLRHVRYLNAQGMMNRLTIRPDFFTPKINPILCVGLLIEYLRDYVLSN